MLRCSSPQCGEVDFLREFPSRTQIRSAGVAWIHGPPESIELGVFDG